MKYVLNVQLGPNFMTEDPDDYRGYVVTNGSYNLDDVIRMVKEEGVETSEATIKASVTRVNRKAAQLAVSGHNVNTGLVYLQPMIKGRFYDTVWDPARHSVYVVATQGADIREALADVEVRILGEKGEAMQLFTITNLVNGNTDGYLTRGRNAEIKGNAIKIDGEDESVGLFFTKTDTKEAVKIPEEFIVVNEPSRVIILVPDTLEPGEYEVSITTQYGYGRNLRKTPRTSILPLPVVVE